MVSQKDKIMSKQKELSYYDYGATTLYACQYDHRFSYFAYIPNNYHVHAEKKYPLVVLIHGTNRSVQRYRDEFKDFAEEEDVIVLVPVFPAGIETPDDLSSYKFIKSNSIRYDLVLLAMIDELSQKYRIQDDQFLLYGFSGGGQFVHRFYYLYPERLMAVSIGAPGRITYLDSNKKWYLGIENIEDEFNIKIDLEEMRKVPVHMVVGEEDTDGWEINNKHDPYWVSGFEENGNTRIERLQALQKNYMTKGIDVYFDLVPGNGHKGLPLMPRVQQFFSKVLHKSIERK